MIIFLQNCCTVQLQEFCEPELSCARLSEPERDWAFMSHNKTCNSMLGTTHPSSGYFSFNSSVSLSLTGLHNRRFLVGLVVLYLWDCDHRENPLKRNLHNSITSRPISLLNCKPEIRQWKNVLGNQKQMTNFKGIINLFSFNICWPTFQISVNLACGEIPVAGLWA